MARHSVPSGKANYGPNTAVSDGARPGWPAVMPFRTGMQPPPNCPKKLYRECNRIAWALRCKAKPRAQLMLVLDRYDQQIVALRRQHDTYLAALEVLDPELHRRAVEHVREMDDPRMALAWEQRGGDADGA